MRTEHRLTRDDAHRGLQRIGLNARCSAAARPRSSARRFQSVLTEEGGEEAGNRRSSAATAPRFPAAYRDDLMGALGDRRRAADRSAGGRRRARSLALPAAGDRSGRAALQALPARAGRVSLSDVLPMFESLGTDGDRRGGRTRVTAAPTARPAWIYGPSVWWRPRTSRPTRIRDRFHDGFRARLETAKAELDGFQRG